MKTRFAVTVILVYILFFLTYNPSGYSFATQVIDLAKNPIGWIIIAVFLAVWCAVLYFVYISTRVVVTGVVLICMGLLLYNLYYYQADVLFSNQWISLCVWYLLAAVGVATCLLWPRIRRGVTGVYSTAVVESPEEEDGE
ncbi:MAG: hypothetical protein IPK84_01965 [Candidatus Moraniibacteriota bacterium]|nr:MAG: hypothetical protein IPK84_01965 [Candidatus Moranbacteria bacterium]